MRAVVDARALGERTFWVDCDVLQADGGTRTASITGAFVALVEALRHLQSQRVFAELPVFDFVAATSVGRVDGQILLDLGPLLRAQRLEGLVRIVKVGGRIHGVVAEGVQRLVMHASTVYPSHSSSAPGGPHRVGR